MSVATVGPILLFCPGQRPDRFAKAIDAADQAILDLEDAVPPHQKDEARDNVVAALAEHDPDKIVVRINQTNTEHGQKDIAALKQTSAKWVMVPKAENPAELAQLDQFQLIVIIESVQGLANIDALCAVDHVAAVVWGDQDFVADIPASRTRDDDGNYLPTITRLRVDTLFAAATARIVPIDAIYIDLNDDAGLRKATIEGFQMGFKAKVALHPRQVPVMRDAIRPDDETIAWARRIVEADAEAAGGVTTVDGTMVDGPIVLQATQVLLLAGEDVPKRPGT